MTEEIDDKIASVEKEAEKTLSRIESDAKKRDASAKSQKRLDITFRSITAILAVAAPALVTYSTTPEVGDAYKLYAILLSGVAGAATTLQVIFGLKEGAVRNSLVALSLYELSADFASKIQQAKKFGDNLEVYSEIKAAQIEANRKHREIVNSDIRAQIDAYRKD